MSLSLFTQFLSNKSQYRLLQNDIEAALRDRKAYESHITPDELDHTHALSKIDEINKRLSNLDSKFNALELNIKETNDEIIAFFQNNPQANNTVTVKFNNAHYSVNFNPDRKTLEGIQKVM